MDKIEKFLRHLSKKEEIVLRKILADIKILNLKNYDIKSIQGAKSIYRIRKGKIRIVFFKQETSGSILDLVYRKDAYKKH